MALSEAGIIREVAKHACDRVTRHVIANLQQLRDGLLSGDDSGLTNAWEEICVQVQGEESFAWQTYVETAKQMVSAHVALFPTYERDAVWLQTPEGEEWGTEDEESRDLNPAFDDDLVGYIWQVYIVESAEGWSNPRIRRYLSTCC